MEMRHVLNVSTRRPKLEANCTCGHWSLNRTVADDESDAFLEELVTEAHESHVERMRYIDV